MKECTDRLAEDGNKPEEKEAEEQVETGDKHIRKQRKLEEWEQKVVHRELREQRGKWTREGQQREKLTQVWCCCSCWCSSASSTHGRSRLNQRASVIRGKRDGKSVDMSGGQTEQVKKHF